MGEKYENYLENLRIKVKNVQADLRHIKGELIEKLNINQNTKTNLEEFLKKEGKNSWLEQLNKMTIKCEELELSLLNTERFQPLGIDSIENIFWDFPCFNELVIEVKNIDNTQNRWYSLSTENSKKIIDYLINFNQDSNLCKNLLGVFEKYWSKVFESDASTIETDIIDTIETEEKIEPVESNAIKAKLVIYEKPSTRLFSKRSLNAEQALENLKNCGDIDWDNNNSDYIKEIEIIKNDIKKKEDDELEIKTEWSKNMDHFFGSHLNYTIENLILYLVNQACYINFTGNSNILNYEKLILLVKDTLVENNLEKKFDLLRKIVKLSFNIINHKLKLFYFENGKKGFIDEIVDQSQSLSNLYFISLISFQFINWKYLKIRQCCGLCKKMGAKFQVLKEFDNLKINDEFGFYCCYKCDIQSESRFTHTKCVSLLPDDDKSKVYERLKTSSFCCNSCIEV